jgi:CheY-like chemotaxis protein
MMKYFQIPNDRASNAKEALALLQQNRYTVAIIDLHMPEIDGWGLLQEIRGNAQTAAMPCVAITVYHDGRVVREALQAGFKACFAKPLKTTFIQDVQQMLSSS